MLSKIKVSVIVPAYNAELFIKKCIDSILTQTLEEIELIIINDGSSDGTLKEIFKYKDKKIKIINSLNSGPGGARNKGLKIAKGEYIAFVDSDDWIDKNMYKDMYNKAKKMNLDIVVCDYYIESIEKSEVIRVKDMKEEKKYVLLEEKSLFFKLGYLVNKIWKKEILLGEEFIEDCTYEDLEMVPKLISKAKFIGKIDFPYYHYMMRKGSITNSNLKLKDKLRALKRLEDNLIKNKKIELFKDEYNYLYYLAIIQESRYKIYNQIEILLDLFEIDFKLFFKKIKKNKYMLIKDLFLISLFNKNILIYLDMIYTLKSIKYKSKNIKFIIKKIIFLIKGTYIYGDVKKISLKVKIKNKGIIIANENSEIYSNATLVLEKNSILYLNKNSSIGRDVSIYLREKKYLFMNENSFFNEKCIISGGNIKIGKNVLIAPRVNIISVNHGIEMSENIISQKEIQGEIIIENDVWIGINTTILLGVKIKQGSIVGANSLLNKNINKNEIWGGNPAKFIKKRG